MFDYEQTMVAALDTETQHIARGLRQRDLALLEELVARYHFRLVRYLIYLLGRRDGVDDLVQETWLRVFERGGSYNPRSRFEPWLFTIARNLALDSLRKRRCIGAEQDGEALPLVSGAPSPFELAARTEDAQRLALTLQTLEPIYREALLLRFQEDLSLQEMAAILGVPLTTISSRIYRGLDALRAQLEKTQHAH